MIKMTPEHISSHVKGNKDYNKTKKLEQMQAYYISEFQKLKKDTNNSVVIPSHLLNPVGIVHPQKEVNTTSSRAFLNTLPEVFLNKYNLNLRPNSNSNSNSKIEEFIKKYLSKNTVNNMNSNKKHELYKKNLEEYIEDYIRNQPKKYSRRPLYNINKNKKSSSENANKLSNKLAEDYFDHFYEEQDYEDYNGKDMKTITAMTLTPATRQTLKNMNYPEYLRLRHYEISREKNTKNYQSFLQYYHARKIEKEISKEPPLDTSYLNETILVGQDPSKLTKERMNVSKAKSKELWTVKEQNALATLENELKITTDGIVTTDLNIGRNLNNYKEYLKLIKKKNEIIGKYEQILKIFRLHEFTTKFAEMQATHKKTIPTPIP